MNDDFIDDISLDEIAVQMEKGGYDLRMKNISKMPLSPSKKKEKYLKIMSAYQELISEYPDHPLHEIIVSDIISLDGGVPQSCIEDKFDDAELSQEGDNYSPNASPEVEDPDNPDTKYEAELNGLPEDIPDPSTDSHESNEEQNQFRIAAEYLTKELSQDYRDMSVVRNTKGKEFVLEGDVLEQIVQEIKNLPNVMKMEAEDWYTEAKMEKSIKRIRETSKMVGSIFHYHDELSD